MKQSWLEVKEDEDQKRSALGAALAKRSEREGHRPLSSQRHWQLLELNCGTTTHNLPGGNAAANVGNAPQLPANVGNAAANVGNVPQFMSCRVRCTCRRPPQGHDSEVCDNQPYSRHVNDCCVSCCNNEEDENGRIYTFCAYPR